MRARKRASANWGARRLLPSRKRARVGAASAAIASHGDKCVAAEAAPTGVTQRLAAFFAAFSAFFSLGVFSGFFLSLFFCSMPFMAFSCGWVWWLHGATLQGRWHSVRVDLKQLDLEHQRGVRRNRAAGAALAVTQCRGNQQDAFAAHAHAGHAFVPALDDAAL